MSSNFYTADGAAMSSKQDDWETPQQLFDELDAEFHFTLDAASTDGNAKCAKHYTEQDSAFNHSWEGETVFCNPPYGRKMIDWIRKCSQEASKPNTMVVLLIPARTDTKCGSKTTYCTAQRSVSYAADSNTSATANHSGQAHSPA